MSKLETNQVDPATGTTLTLGTSGDTITIPSGVTIANSGTATGFGGDNTPAFSARIGSNQTVTDNTDTKVNFDTEDFDTDSAYDTTNKRFTVPSGEAGKYFFYTRGRFLQNSISQYVIAFRVNGSEVAKKYIYSGAVGTSIFNSIQYFSFDISAVETLSVGDYVEVYVKADSTGGGDITYESSTIQSEFTGYKLIGV